MSVSCFCFGRSQDSNPWLTLTKDIIDSCHLLAKWNLAWPRTWTLFSCYMASRTSLSAPHPKLDSTIRISSAFRHLHFRYLIWGMKDSLVLKMRPNNLVSMTTLMRSLSSVSSGSACILCNWQKCMQTVLALDGIQLKILIGKPRKTVLLKMSLYPVFNLAVWLTNSSY